MDGDTNRTRRTFLTGTGTLAVGALAGCLGGQGGPAGGNGSGETNGTGNESGEGENETAGGSETPYTVSMAPVGEVEFEAVPETFAAYEPGYADMAVALGRGDGLLSVGLKERYYTDVYDELDGVSVDTDSLTALVDNGIDREVFYELGADLHLMDPQWLVNNGSFGLEQSDIDAVADQVAPFFGNTIFRRTDEWHDYEYYTLYEAFGKVAEVFQEGERYEAFAAVHDAMLEEVEANLPGEDERPNALLTYAAADEPEEFSPYRVSGEGTNKKQFHDLGIDDALEGTGISGLSTTERGTIDYETMLEVDPDSILVRGHETKTEEEFRETVLAYMQQDSVASELTAVQEERVFRGGPIYAGPIHNLFLTERFAGLYYPDAFSGELFDRSEVSDVVTGTF
ncbi:ABC transporter substrate-binding protein [Halomarina ordinaria]|uniref:ABC transporter substrate-binding protein n=1 Tax=Halomarina ordinaria TaxID=3033939 RepID=A0ABD5UBW2_9EURY|nr:ABC transporter substrate-binding protein [Halomarina sp. PSRA2]